ncbi:helix-turn-helix domain-containing protein [Streptomyces triticiradicis]|uniref:Helix-turn-helix transcriptional regulator n=1 Tax=Streptomyces triticiradicis TaxID=2651189 RepID=A0A7J5D5B5_9ACTN|nr:helix-turn-helix transcriptional regulator [Streptomyces triticiradicis]KAB1979453.1 helix-turn-helix transcriptional regulator [Streptomyces triticiradicis]
MTQQHPFSSWLTRELALRGYDLTKYGTRSRFARDAGLGESIVSRVLRGDAVPDIKTCAAIAQVLGCQTTHVLIAAGLIPDEGDLTSRPLTQREHLVGLVGDDVLAQEAVIVLLRALGKWTP